MNEVYAALIKYGILGPVVAWAFWMIFRLQERLFTLIQDNTTALNTLAQKIERLANRLAPHDGPALRGGGE